MREILFRGKRTSEGEWIEGTLFRLASKLHPFIMLTDRYAESYEVDPETVGQFTGLTDKNGKKIFEGDIIKHYNNTRYPEQFEIGMVWWDDCHLCFKRTSNPKSVYVWHRNTYEVIGNIHDNPELLEKK